jgi:phosphate transport system substrate-binding protein
MADLGGAMPDTMAVSIVNAPGKESWPIAGYTYLIIYMDQQDCARGKAVVDFIKWGVSDAASKFAVELDYVPLPESVRTQVFARLGQVTCQGKPLQ